MITITEACSIKIAELLAEENNPNLNCRCGSLINNSKQSVGDKYGT